MGIDRRGGARVTACGTDRASRHSEAISIPIAKLSSTRKSARAVGPMAVRLSAA